MSLTLLAETDRIVDQKVEQKIPKDLASLRIKQSLQLIGPY